MALVKNTLNVVNEQDIWHDSRFRRTIGMSHQDVDDVVLRTYKVRGPADSTALLNNMNIDSVMEQWARNYRMHGKAFYHMAFQMIDFAETGGELANLSLAELINKKYDCFGVVINTDVSTGGGKHWFCVYGDLCHEGTDADPIVIEFFNSSGNGPVDQMLEWMEGTIHEMWRDHKLRVEWVRAAPTRLQNSNTECGMWSLMYIKNRLDGHDVDYFYKAGIKDSDMIKARQQLFRI